MDVHSTTARRLMAAKYTLASALVALAATRCQAPDGGAEERAQPLTDGMLEPDADAVVALLDVEGHTVCTGTLIDAHVVLTAGHCLAGGAPISIAVPKLWQRPIV